MNDLERSAELDRLRNSPLGWQTETSLLDPSLRLMDGPSFVPQYEEIFLSEIYDFPFEGSEPVILDCGANIGTAVIWWRSRWPGSRIVAFEPDSEVFKVLEWNTRYHSGLDLRQVAVGNIDGTGTFYPEGSDAGRLDRQIAGRDMRVPVEVESLAGILSEFQVVDLLKIDIEGAETSALLSAESELARVQRVFVEYHSFPEEPQLLGELLNLLKRSAFRYYCETPLHAVRPFQGVPTNQGIDLQLNIFGWRAS